MEGNNINSLCNHSHLLHHTNLGWAVCIKCKVILKKINQNGHDNQQVEGKDHLHIHDLSNDKKVEKIDLVDIECKKGEGNKQVDDTHQQDCEKGEQEKPPIASAQSHENNQQVGRKGKFCSSRPDHFHRHHIYAGNLYEETCNLMSEQVFADYLIQAIDDRYSAFFA